MPRSNSKSPMLTIFGWLVLFSSAGCSSLDHAAIKDLEQAERSLHSEPGVAVPIFDRLITKSPDDPRLLRGRATALEALDRFEGAIQDWTHLLELSTEQDDADQILLSHGGIGRCLLWALGRPAAAYSPASPERIARLNSGLKSFRAVLSGGGQDDFALFGLAYCEFGLGRLANSKQTVDRLLDLDAEHEDARFLDLRIRQELVGVSPAWIRELAGFLDSDDSAVWTATARELLAFAHQPDLSTRVKLEVAAGVELIRDTDDLPKDIATLLAQLDTEQVEQRSRRESQQQISIARRARRNHEWPTGWKALLRAESLGAKVDSEKRAFTDAWANFLADRIERDLRGIRVGLAKKELDALKAVPTDFLSSDVTERIATVEVDFADAWARHRIDDQMNDARSKLRDGKATAALTILDELSADVPTQRRVEFDLLHAQAMADCDRPDDAVEILDRIRGSGALKEFKDTEVFRVYGVLLSRVGRSEEAQAILEELPLYLFDSRAFEALLTALQQQGEWESVLARLQGLSTIPAKYRSVMVHSAAQAARRRLRGSDPDAAKRLLNSYLQESDYQDPQVQDVYLEILVETDHFEEAAELILNANESLLSKLPTKLLGMVRSKAEETLSAEDKFDLFVRLMAHDDDPDLAQTVEDLWPQYGSYFPKPGSYVAEYQVRTINGKSTQDITPGEMTVEWKGDHFEIESPLGNENWRFESNVWIRNMGGVEMRYPCQASARPPHPVEQYKSGGQLWSAQVIEFGATATAAGRRYPNCLKIQVINEANQNQFRYLFLAPDTGMVLQEEYRFGEVINKWELKSFTPVDKTKL